MWTSIVRCHVVIRYYDILKNLLVLDGDFLSMVERAGVLKIQRETKTLRQLAIENLRNAIQWSRFKPGQRLHEQTLCDELGVSRTVVREALRHLEAEGLIETRPHQGPFVATIDASTARQIYQVRAALEAMAARAAAEIDGDHGLKAMKKALKHLQLSQTKADMQATLKATSEFYEAMFMRGDCIVAWNIVQTLNARINHLRSMTMESSGRSENALQEVQDIFDAIERGNAEQAEKACTNHVNNAAAIAQQLLNNPRQ